MCLKLNAKQARYETLDSFGRPRRTVIGGDRPLRVRGVRVGYRCARCEAPRPPNPPARSRVSPQAFVTDLQCTVLYVHCSCAITYRLLPKLLLLVGCSLHSSREPFRPEPFPSSSSNVALSTAQHSLLNELFEQTRELKDEKPNTLQNCSRVNRDWCTPSSIKVGVQHRFSLALARDPRPVS